MRATNATRNVKRKTTLQADDVDAGDADATAATVARRRAAHEQIISRQSTVEFISSLLGGTDTPDAPLEQKFEGLPSTVAEMTALAEAVPLDARAAQDAASSLAASAHKGTHDNSGGVPAEDPYARERAFLSLGTSGAMNTLGPFLGDAVARGGGARPGASVAEALRRRARDIEEAEQRDLHARRGGGDARHDHASAAGDARSRLRVHSAPEPGAGIPNGSGAGAGSLGSLHPSRPSGRLLENTETHLPAAAVRRTAERQEMQLARNQAHQQAWEAREAQNANARAELANGASVKTPTPESGSGAAGSAPASAPATGGDAIGPAPSPNDEAFVAVKTEPVLQKEAAPEEAPDFGGAP